MKYLIYDADPKDTFSENAGRRRTTQATTSKKPKPQGLRGALDPKHNVECLSKLIITSERGLLRVLREYLMSSGQKLRAYRHDKVAMILHSYKLTFPNLALHDRF